MAILTPLLLALVVQTAPPATRDAALAAFGPPAARVALPDGGERLRWVKAEESVLAGLFVTTIEVDHEGKVIRLDRKTLRGPGRAAY